jgi:hypothetical protein
MTDESGRRKSALAYTDLKLELRGFNIEADSYQVVLSGVIGEFEGTARLVRSEIDEALLEMEDGGIEEEEDLITFGRALADRLLPEGAIRTQVTEAIRATGVGTGVRLRLVIGEPSLAELPWEYTYLSLLGRNDPHDFLVRYPTVSMVRDEPLPLPHGSISPREAGHLRLAVATANAPGYLRLDLDKERHLIQTALDDIPAIDYKPILVDPTAADLQKALVGGADMFHFAGHGGVQDGEGFVALPSDDRTDVVRLDANTLAGFLQYAGIRLAVVGACESGRRDALSRWTGVVPALVAGVPGIPAVVAMQYRIRDSAAINFSRAFYSSIAAGLSVDESVFQGRLALLLDADDMTASWGLPVLYLRSSDGVTFPDLAERPSPSANALREAINVRVKTVEGVVMGVDAADAESLRAADALRAGTVNVTAGNVRKEGKVIGARIGYGRKDDDPAMQALRLRLAKGEITLEQFNELKRGLE